LTPEGKHEDGICRRLRCKETNSTCQTIARSARDRKKPPLSLEVAGKSAYYGVFGFTFFEENAN
jgi:hypothetical protein